MKKILLTFAILFCVGLNAQTTPGQIESSVPPGERYKEEVRTTNNPAQPRDETPTRVSRKDGKLPDGTNVAVKPKQGMKKRTVNSDATKPRTTSETKTTTRK